MTSCIVVDDERPAIQLLEKYIGRIGELKLSGSFTNPLDAVKFVQGQKVDVIFLDINMDELTGIEVMNILGDKTKVIFCTAFSEFAVESYELNAVDYLMKPISFARFERAVGRLNLKKEIIKRVPDDYIFVRADQNRRMIRVDIRDIDFIEARSNYIAIYKMSKPVLVYSSLKDIEDYLHDSNFIRVHKSYLVPESRIQMIESNTIILKGCTKKIPVSKSYKEKLMERLEGRTFSR
ncbi:MAG: response regulator transcription factor [Chitinophagaceae bacterium]|nr:response regulator transcription factor [Chitinophagaceae bacterium]